MRRKVDVYWLDFRSTSHDLKTVKLTLNSKEGLEEVSHHGRCDERPNGNNGSMNLLPGCSIELPLAVASQAPNQDAEETLCSYRNRCEDLEIISRSFTPRGSI